MESGAMPELRVIEYDRRRTAASRIPDEVWASHEPRIRELFALPVKQKQMREILRRECRSGNCGSSVHPCSFRPSAPQLSRQLLAWNLRVLESRQTRTHHNLPTGSSSQRSFTHDGSSEIENIRPSFGISTRQSVSSQSTSHSHGHSTSTSISEPMIDVDNNHRINFFMRVPSPTPPASLSEPRPYSSLSNSQSVNSWRTSARLSRSTSTSVSELIPDFIEDCEGDSRVGAPGRGSITISNDNLFSPSEKSNDPSQGLPTDQDTPIKPADDWLSTLGISFSHLEYLVHWCAFAISSDTVGIEAALQETPCLDTKAAIKLHGPAILYQLFLFSWLDQSRRRRLSIMAGKEDLRDLFRRTDAPKDLNLSVLYTLSSMIIKHTNDILTVPAALAASLSIKTVLFSVTISLCEVVKTFVEEFVSTANLPPPETQGKRRRPERNRHAFIGEGVCLLCIYPVSEREVKELVTKSTLMDRYLNEPEFRGDITGRNLQYTSIPEHGTTDEGNMLGPIEEDIDNETPRSSTSGSFKMFRDLASRLKRNSTFSETSRRTGKSSLGLSFNSWESRMSWRFSRVTGMSSNPSNRDSHSIRDSIIEDAMDTS